jgi:hypothetical protein
MLVTAGSATLEVLASLLERHPEIWRLRLRPYVPTLSESPRTSSPERFFRHHRGAECTWQVPLADRLQSLEAFVQVLAGETRAVGFCSRLEMRDGTLRHALLMDYRAGGKPDLLPLIREACDRLGRPGWILETTRSYHFVGDDIVDEDVWMGFMGRWLLAEHLSDVPFIGHCVIERVSCLRLTSVGGQVPRVVTRVAAGRETPFAPR